MRPSVHPFTGPSRPDQYRSDITLILTPGKVKRILSARMEGQAMNEYLLWGLAGLGVVLILALAAVAVRRRLERGRPARFSIGLRPVDIIEGLTGRELSRRTQAAILAGSIASALMLVVVGLYLLTQQAPSP
jgi:hypothetical protein